MKLITMLIGGSAKTGSIVIKLGRGGETVGRMVDVMGLVEFRGARRGMKEKRITTPLYCTLWIDLMRWLMGGAHFFFIIDMRSTPVRRSSLLNPR